MISYLENLVKQILFTRMNEYQLISIRFLCDIYEQGKHLSSNIIELFPNAAHL